MTNKRQIIYQVDAFTSEPFKGNPAGVCIMEDEPPVEWMQKIAMEMNLSETAFLFMKGKKQFIRFFSPESEVPLCGHATLSASHILFETGLAKQGEVINLVSKAGLLTINKRDERLEMTFPSYNTRRIEIPADFKKITGFSPLELYTTDNGWSLAFLKNEKEVRELKPQFHTMKESQFGDLIVTAVSDDPEFDFCVRCFAPALGINEDPVTGSAHCALVPFWHLRTGRKEFMSHQVSKRGGVLKLALRGDKVEISGQAVTILLGELYV